MSAQVTPEFLEQLEDLIQYVWEDEESHWEESGRPDNHIFVKIKKLNDWLAGVTKADVRSLTPRKPDVWDSAPSQALSTSEQLPLGGADTTPPTRR